MGAATSLVENLIFLFMRDELSATYLVCGLSVLITVIFEIPIFYMNKKAKETISSENMIFIAMFCYVTRVCIYTLAGNPFVILLVEPLHGKQRMRRRRKG